MTKTDRQHSYRFGYLKSEHWRGLRLERLAKDKARCVVCFYTSWQNDVHHLNYRNLKDVKRRDLRTLCRPCHNLIHVVMEKYPDWRLFSRSFQRWQYLRRRAKTMRRLLALHGLAVAEKLPQVPVNVGRIRFYNRFKKMRRLATRARYPKQPQFWRWELPWNERLFLMSSGNITGWKEMLTAYLQATNFKTLHPCGEH